LSSGVFELPGHIALTLPPNARAADQNQSHGRKSDVAALADDSIDSAVTRFSYMPIEGETPLILTSAFGRYRVSVPGDDRPRRVTSRMAFFCRPAQPDGPDRPAEQTGEFWACRTTFAVDGRTGHPHRLIWGLNEKGTLVTIARPELAAPEDSRNPPPLIPVDAMTFNKITSTMSEDKQKSSADGW
jgi:hypothetical protein